ncbi:MAG: BON domain-containing protein [Pseudobdellovibrionaceae bacterium]
MKHQRTSGSEKSEQSKGKSHGRSQERSQGRMEGQQMEEDTSRRWQDRDVDREYQDQGYRMDDTSRYSSSDRNYNMETNQRPYWGRGASEEESPRGGRAYYDEGSYGSQQSMGSQYGSQSYGSQQDMGYQRGGRTEATGRYVGRGPKGYTRSDERIKEEICEILTRDPNVDASDIEIEVKEGEVTLSGFVPDRKMKHSAEDLIEKCMGVKDIINNLRIQKEEPHSESETERGERRGSSGSSSKKSGSTSTSNLSH